MKSMRSKGDSIKGAMTVKFIKKYRIDNGFTQEKLAEKVGVSTVTVQNWENGINGVSNNNLKKLAEIFNVPFEKLINEMDVEHDRAVGDNWPGFLFDEKIDEIINSLHLNLLQQNIFGCLYIYGREYLDETDTDADAKVRSQVEDEISIFYRDLKLIPVEFINKVGSIKFMSYADDLFEVIRYIKPEFLLKVLKGDPDKEFNIRKISKDLICEFIDDGYREYAWSNLNVETKDGRYTVFGISMRKAGIILPFLKEEKYIKLIDEHEKTVISQDLPDNVFKIVLEMQNMTETEWEQWLKRGLNHYVSSVIEGIETVTNYDYDTGVLTINEKGEKLLEWFNDK